MLEMFLWDNYKDEEISPQLKYWADYWSIRVNRILDKSDMRILNSPRLLLNDILSEIEFNNLRNEKIKSLFQKTTKFWRANSNVLSIETVSCIILLDEGFKKENHSYLAELCRNNLEKLSNGEFFKTSLVKLKYLLLKDNVTEKEYEQIEILSEILIAEYIFNGHDLKSCSLFPRKIFSFCQKVSESPLFITSEFPAKTMYRNFESLENTDEAYSNALVEEIKLLTIDKRIDALASLYELENNKLRVIFPLDGIVGDEEITVGEVKIYSPEFKKYVKEDGRDRDIELFGQDPPHVFNNAMVEVEARDYKVAEDMALEKIEAALDILRYFQEPKVNIGVFKNGCLMTNLDGDIRFESMSRKRDGLLYWSVYDSLQTIHLTPEHRSKISSLGEKLGERYRPSTSKEQLVAALHWFRKANEEHKLEDRLLNLWVALEKMFPEKTGDFQGKSKIDMILDLVPYIYINFIKYRIAGWSTFYRLESFLGGGQGGKPYLVLPQDVRVKAQLSRGKKGELIDLRNFIGCLDEIVSKVDRKVIKDEVIYARNFFMDNKFAKKVFEDELQRTYEDLLIIYRYRNKIVHDAHYNDKMLNFYIETVSNYVAVCIRVLIDEVDSETSNMYDVALKKKIELKRIMEQLSLDPSFKLVDLQSTS